MVSSQWSVVGGRWSVVSGQWSVVSGRWSVVSGQETESSAEGRVQGDRRFPLVSHRGSAAGF